MLLADILIFRGVNTLYTYSIPAELSDTLQVGHTVNIPFGPSTTQGLVCEIRETEEENKRTKPIINCDFTTQKLSAEMVKLILWFSTYYCCSPHKAWQTVSGKRKVHDLPEFTPTPHPFKVFFELSPKQSTVFDAIMAENAPKKTLIHGVTGSGKTELYMRVAKQLILSEKNCIILVPEIALTPQFQEQFTQRFGEDCIAILHSGMTKKQKELAHQKIQSGIINIVIGPRSAVFADLPNIGAIMIDEEHDGSYKQENHPRYHTQTIAERRCTDENARLILGSATPNIDTYFRYSADPDRQVLTLSERVNSGDIPPVTLLDSAEAGSQIFHPELIRQIQSRIEKKEKCMLLINRRGYSPYIVCSKCGQHVACPECQLGMTYHNDKTFRCHRCFIKQKAHNFCSHCKEHSLSFAGLAIQKIEGEIAKQFQEATVYRLDKDNASTAKKLEKILKSFKKDGDILIGTQMIAKGHHIEDVTLVGVLGIDMTLNMPDFRAPERTFQLLTQVAGRAGRGKKKGQVFIQTRHARHYAIKASKTHGFMSFYEEELSYRKRSTYPPFSRLINIIFSATELTDLLKYAQDYHRYMQENTGDLSCKMTPPRPAAIEKVNQHHRYHILFKLPDAEMAPLKTIIKKAPLPPKTVRCILDFDPQSLL